FLLCSFFPFHISHIHTHTHTLSLSLSLSLSNGAADLCANSNNKPIPKPASCPVKCFQADPVCSVDGMTYWCGYADAFCAGVKVAKLGFCEVGNGGPSPPSDQALLLIHIVWLIVLRFSVLFELF
ncbi:hypothetical protein CFP56_021833, partial [Quercus suber]